MKYMIVLGLGLMVSVNTSGQIINAIELNPSESIIDFSPSQISGFTLLGPGASAIMYTAAGTYPSRCSSTGYIGGGALAATGALFLIFGDKEPEIKYWKGMERFNAYDTEIRFSSQVMHNMLFAKPVIGIFPIRSPAR